MSLLTDIMEVQKDLTQEQAIAVAQYGMGHMPIDFSECSRVEYNNFIVSSIAEYFIEGGT